LARNTFALLVVLGIAGCGESSTSSRDDGGSGGTGQGGTTTTGGASTGGSVTGGSAGSGGSGGLRVPYFQPGTRLKPEVLTELGSGIELVTLWRDVSLGMYCRFEKAEDGVERCLPPPGASRYYSDAGCTAPLYLAILGSSGECPFEAPAHFAYDLGVEAPDGCRATVGLRNAGELPSSTPLFANVQGVCEPVDRATLADRLIYQGEPLAPEAFVGLERVRRPFLPELEAYVRAGEDGSWETLMFFNPEREAPCWSIYGQGITDLKCLPTWEELNHFTDASCQVKAAERELTFCPLDATDALVVLTPVPDACPQGYSYEFYEISELREAQLYRDVGGGVCEPDSILDEPVQAYIQGAPIDPATFPLLELLEVGTSRVQGVFFGYEGTPLVPFRRGAFFVDSSSGEKCSPYDFADGTTRCVPVRSSEQPAASTEMVSSEGIFYESASCTGKRFVPNRPDSCMTNPPPPTRLGVGAESQCSPVLIAEVVALSAPSNPSALYRVNADTNACESVNPADLGGSFLELGAALDPAEEFAEMQRVLRD
jgi:hypothetical protein